LILRRTGPKSEPWIEREVLFQMQETRRRTTKDGIVVAYRRRRLFFF
jgi:hypothetical protein